MSLKSKIYKYFWPRIFYSNFTRNLSSKILRTFNLYPFPSCIEVEVTTKCGLKCIMCEHSYWKEPSIDMSFEQFKSIVDQFPTLAWIGLTGIGESFLNPDFMKMLRYVKSKSITVELYDNFNFTTKDMIKELVDLGVERIYVSLDAATKETYKKIRVGANFEKVIENVKTLLEYKERKKSQYPNKLDFHYIVSSLNVNELVKFIELIHSLNVQKNTEILFTRVLHSFKEIKGIFTEIPKEVIYEAEKRAKELGIKIVWGGDVPLIKPPIKNCTAWMMPFIFVTGHVIPCCAVNECNEREFQKEHAMGNIFKTPFKEIWKGDRYNELRKMLRKNKRPVVCKNCTIYDLEAKNGKRQSSPS